MDVSVTEVNVGTGLTIMKNERSAPGQLFAPTAIDTVTTIMGVGIVSVFVAVKGPISPDPLVPKPISWEQCHENTAPGDELLK